MCQVTDDDARRKNKSESQAVHLILRDRTWLPVQTANVNNGNLIRARKYDESSTKREFSCERTSTKFLKKTNLYASIDSSMDSDNNDDCRY